MKNTNQALRTVPAEMLTQDQAANRLGIAKATLAKWRSIGHPNIPYIKLGRCIRYQDRDLEAFLSKHTINSMEG